MESGRRSAWRIFSVRSSVELSSPVVVHCHGHLPIYPIWACPWAKSLSNQAALGSELAEPISLTAGWVYTIRSCCMELSSPSLCNIMVIWPRPWIFSPMTLTLHFHGQILGWGVWGCVACVDVCVWVEGEWVIRFNGLLRTADIEVQVVHTSRVIIAYTLESLSSHTYITHNLQATINFKETKIKKENQKCEDTHKVDLSLEMVTLHQYTIPVILN